MKLISLTCDKPSFHSVTFNRRGLSLVVGRRRDPTDKDEKRTFNGVGKSLLIAIIHFCLGSDRNAQFETKLCDWTFFLEFEVNGSLFVASRNTSEQEAIHLNSSVMTLPKFREWLLNQCFHFSVPEPPSSLKFRPLIKRFIRPNKASYAYFDRPDNQETQYYRLLYNGFLLGLDVHLIAQKYQLKRTLDRVRELKRNVEKDEVIRSFFEAGKNVKIELQDLDERIAILRDKLGNFRVAEDYSILQEQADETKSQLKGLRNEATLLRNAIRDIELSLTRPKDITADQVLRLFSDASIHLSDLVIHRVEEVIRFHDTLLDSRQARLYEERSRLTERLDECTKQIEEFGFKLDSQIRFLSEHGALEEFVSLTALLTDLVSQSLRLQNYRDLLENYTTQIQTTTKQLHDENIVAGDYLKEYRELIDGNMRTFRKFSKEFYADKPGGLTVENNDGENQIRFNIEAKIQDDASDGINEVKIFCYDATILEAQHNHRVNFLFHDSRLFSDVDPRQRSTLFRVAHQLCLDNDFQYIAAINEDQLLSMREQYTEEDFNRMLVSNQVLVLTDASPAEKLLGIEVDMVYD